MGDAGAADRGVPPEGQDRTTGPAAHDVSHSLAASKRREVALCPGGAWPLVTGGSDLHPLGTSGRLAAPPWTVSGEGRATPDRAITEVGGVRLVHGCDG